MDGGQATLPAPVLASPAPPAPAPRRRGKRLLLAALAVVLLAGGGWYGWHWWTTLRFLEETEENALAVDIAVPDHAAASVAR